MSFKNQLRMVLYLLTVAQPGLEPCVPHQEMSLSVSLGAVQDWNSFGYIL